MAKNSTARIFELTDYNGVTVCNALTVSSEPLQELGFSAFYVNSKSCANPTSQYRFSENRIQDALSQMLHLVNQGELNAAYKLESKLMNDFPDLNESARQKLDLVAPGHYQRCVQLKSVAVPAAVQQLEAKFNPQTNPNLTPPPAPKGPSRS